MKLDFTNATSPVVGLPDISELSELSNDDKRCLAEIKEVLHRHGRQRTFGVTRLHSHFLVANDEVLIEECDQANRTLTIRPCKKASVQGDRVIETNWRLDTGDALMGCSQYCTQSGSSHSQHHATSIQ